MAYSWLYEVLVFWLHEVFGLTCIVAHRTVLMAWQRGLSEENSRWKGRGAHRNCYRGRRARLRGLLYDDFNRGGFLIWRLPRLPVVLDGRTNLHGDERILRIGNTWAAGPGWRDDPDLIVAGVVVADARSPLAGALVLDERFQLVHEDPVACVFVRRQAGSGSP